MSTESKKHDVMSESERKEGNIVKHRDEDVQCTIVVNGSKRR